MTSIKSISKTKGEEIVLLSNIIKELNEEKRALKKEVTRLQKTCDSLEKALNEKNSKHIFAVIKTHKDYKTIVTYEHSDNDVTIRIWPIDEFISTSQYLRCGGVFDRVNHKAKIQDIYAKTRDKGLGQLAISEFIKIAKEEGLKKITGELSSSDLKDNKDRLMHFYTKLGFKIHLYENPKTNVAGEIMQEI